ncbi:MAG: LptF/LptG family permease [Gemmatimonadota bacterium]|nr:LptF/LptG family permease [Gemmatimonadota bacterium]
MRLRRYVISELIMPFLFGFSVIIFLLVIDLILQMLDRILGKGVPIGVVFELFFLNTAWMIALAVPMAVLVSTLLAFGRLSAAGEIVAMRALGIGIHQVVVPVLLVAALLGIGLVIFNDRILPEFNHRARVLMTDIHRKRPAVALADKAGVMIGDFKNYQILFDRADAGGNILHDVLVYSFNSDGFPETAVADSGVVEFDEARDEALLYLFNGEMHRIDPDDPTVYALTTFAKARLRLGDAGQQLSRSSSAYRNDREMDIATMQHKIAQYESELHQAKVKRANLMNAFVREVLIDSTDTKPVQSLRAVLGRVAADTRIARHKLRAADRLRVEVHKKFSIPAACVAFVLVGAPIGVWARSSSVAIGAAISIGFFLAWWIFLIGGEKLADRGVLMPWFAMWIPNVLTALVGVVLSARIICEWGVKRR